MGKWFPKFYDTLMGPLEKGTFQDIRKELIQKVHGQVLEIGSGTGINFPYYKKVDKVIGIEPEPLMREQSLKRAQNSHVPIEVLEVSAEELPFPDDSFDSVVNTLVFCTIPDPIKALQEVKRVCKPNGKVLFFEHVRLNHSGLGRLQDLLTPMWKKLCDGCHLNRNTLELVKQAGFNVTAVKRYYKDIFVVFEATNIK
jgi:ubiquinone/menaquinone biosynthesis C-methylase UbiE